jgi:hypothetical protein
VANFYHPSYLGSINSRLIIQDRLGKNVRPYSKNKKKRVVDVAEVTA